MKVRELLSDPSKWTQHCLARLKYGSSTYATNPDATSWCLLGAISKCYGTPYEREAAIKKVDRHLEILGETVTIPIWNDRNTYEDIIKLVTTLDI